MGQSDALYSFDRVPRDRSSFLHVKRTLRESVSAAIRARPDAPYLVWVGNSSRIERTFAELERDLLARAGALGAPGETQVIACVGGNTYENLLNIGAALLSGYSVLPLNAADPADRIRKRVESLPRKTWVVSDREPLPGRGAPARGWTEFRSPEEILLVPSSGTTGEPKIVRQPEIAVLANSDALIEHHRLREEEAWVATPLPLFHVNALGFSFLSTLLSGARLTLFESFRVPTLLDELEAFGITVLSATPSLIRSLLGFADQVEWKRSKLRYVVSAAAPLSCGFAEDWFRKTGVPIVQGYGLSEAVNFSATMPVGLERETYEELMFRSGFPSIGTELRGNELAILDEQGTPLPAGERGEIAVRGWNVMTSYLGEPSLSAQPLERFRTGDLGYFREVAGRKYFFVSGRKKDMIKKAGESLSLREIDDELASHLGSRGDAIAVPHHDENYGENFGVLVAGAELPEEAARALSDHLVRALGKPYRPSAVRSTSETLRTPSGKPQRHRFSGLFEPKA